MRSTSSGSPSRQLSNEGEASRLLRAIMSALPLLARERGLEGQRADLVEGRLGDRADEALEGEALPGAPAPLDQGGEEDGGRRLQRVGLDAHEPEQARHDGLDLVAQVLLGGLEGHGGRVERLQDVERHARPASPACRRPRRGPSSGPRCRRGRGPTRRGPSSRPRPRRRPPSSRPCPRGARPRRRSRARRRRRRASSKRSSRFARSPFGSIASTGTPWRSSSSRRTMARPVLPEPVMPTMSPWVSRSAGSRSSGRRGRRLPGSTCLPR